MQKTKWIFLKTHCDSGINLVLRDKIEKHGGKGVVLVVVVFNRKMAYFWKNIHCNREEPMVYYLCAH